MTITIRLLGLATIVAIGLQYSNLLAQPAAKKTAVTLPYQNAALTPQARAEDLLARMTLEEKIGQMTQIATTEINKVDNPKTKVDRFKPYLEKAKAEKLIKEHHIGSFLAAFAVSPQDWYTFSNDLQKVNMANSRLGIPIIYGNDNVHGANYVAGATIFPQPVNLANTFNLQYAEAMGRITATEISDLGQPWNFAPILDIGRNPYWPRQYETFGEDTYWVGQLGTAYIKALQTAEAAKPYKIAATAKHFIGYSDPKSGWDRSPSVIGDQELREIFLPPFRQAVNAGVKTFMINSGEVNGVPIHASAKYLTGMLRNELGFDGVIVTDWADILQLIGQHHVAHNEKEATLMALKAGIDMSMTASSTTFCTVTKDLVKEGYLSESVIDKAVLRILRLKFDLGLFENPYPRNDRFARIGSKANKQEALEASRESIVLLKNDGILPIKTGPKNILVVGLQANSKRNNAGGWTINWNGGNEDQFPNSIPTLFTALQTGFPGAKVDTSAVAVNGTGKLDPAKLAAADLVIMAVGEEPYAEGMGNIQDLNLSSEQQLLINQVQASGKPNVLVMWAGRPRLITPFLPKANAFIHAGLPGEFGTTALVEILAGKVNPSGKLAITYPGEVGHITPYNARIHDRYTNLFAFGTGLSYTTFQYSDLRVSDSSVNRNGSIKVSVTVRNPGTREGKEASLLFVKDEVRTHSTPLLNSLRGVSKDVYKAGEAKTITFELRPERDFSYPDEVGGLHLEEGYFVIEIGGLKKRVSLRAAGNGLNQKDFKLKNYLQEDIGTN